MVAVAENLTFSEFQATYEKRDRSYEFWYGRAMPKGMPTWIHGLLQLIIGELLKETGYIAGSEVELRIESDASTEARLDRYTGAAEIPYPTSAVDVLVEILSPDDPMAYVIENAGFQSWGFPGIYVVDSDSRLVFRWIGQALEISSVLASIPAERIWEELAKRLVPPTP